MKNIVVLSASNSKQSINKQLAVVAASFIEGIQTRVLDINDFEVPMFGVDYEGVYGVPENAKLFSEELKNSDGIILSLPEHNGNLPAVFKNLTDWVSRLGQKTFADKPMLLMATSPGGRGGATVLEIAKLTFPYQGANIVSEFSLPSFGENFNAGKITNPVYETNLKKAVEQLESSI